MGEAKLKRGSHALANSMRKTGCLINIECLIMGQYMSKNSNTKQHGRGGRTFTGCRQMQCWSKIIEAEKTDFESDEPATLTVKICLQLMFDLKKHTLLPCENWHY